MTPMPPLPPWCFFTHARTMRTHARFVRSYYMDTVAEEVNELLQEHGLVLVTTLCEKYSLPVDFLRQNIETRIGTHVHGRLQGNSS